MIIVNIHKAKTHLSRLIEDVLSGKDVIIAKAGTPLVKLEPYKKQNKKRIPGKYKGKVEISGDFDVLPEEIFNSFTGKSDESFN